MTGESSPAELKTALELCGHRAKPKLCYEQLKQRREEMRAAFAAGPHPSQVQRRALESIPGLQRVAGDHRKITIAPFAARLVDVRMANAGPL